MGAEGHLRRFSEDYGLFCARHLAVREDRTTAPEVAFQLAWYDQLFSDAALRTMEGHSLRVLSPGWWNRQEGPDFKGAQIEFNGVLHTGDVEVHLDAAAWKGHGHHLDPRYDEVILHVVAVAPKGDTAAFTSQGRRIPVLAIGERLPEDYLNTAEGDWAESPASGLCCRCSENRAPGAIRGFLDLAGDWRMLNKARTLRERMDQAGEEQAIYEALLYAAGFSRFKHHFRTIARHLPYERARQLALQEPFLLETALLQIAGLLPLALDEASEVPHFQRLDALRKKRLDGLRNLPLVWRRNGVRPGNYPERRLAGMAAMISRTAREGLAETLRGIWRQSLSPRERRLAFEALFPKAFGFWAEHCTWQGKQMRQAGAALGGGRVRAMIGNVFVPAGLAFARRDRDRLREEAVYAFFEALPQEPKNQVLAVMIPRILGDRPGRLHFRAQQGLIQLHQDWCSANPSCHNCPILRHLAAFSEQPGD